MTRHQKEMRSPLNPLLIIIALVGWGILHHVWWVGVIMAALTLLPQFIRTRKDFLAADYSRAFTLSWLLMAMVVIILWIQDSEREHYKIVVQYLPAFFLPVLLCQLFSTRVDYPMYSSTLLTNWRAGVELKKNPEMDISRINFGYLYLGLVMFAAGWGMKTLNSKAAYVILIAILLKGLLFPKFRKDGLRAGGRVLYLVALLSASLIGIGALNLYKYLDSGGLYKLLTENPNETSTALGKLGQIKLSPEIHWRIIDPEVVPPSKFRDSVFNYYNNKKWSLKPPSEKMIKEDYTEFTLSDFEGEPVYLPDKDLVDSPRLEKYASKYRIRGKGTKTTLLPTLETLQLLNSDSFDAIEQNSGGTIASSPSSGVVDYTFHAGPPGVNYLEYPPHEKYDLIVPKDLEIAVEKFKENFEIEAGSPAALAALQLRTAFLQNYEYSLEGEIVGNKPLFYFLTHHQRGHCEYFASAGVMLLRSMGIPARYCVGYMVSEQDDRRNEWVLRGLHVHAWIRMWDAERESWVDVDFTPPDPNISSHAKKPFYQGLLDALKRGREDFVVWREENDDSWVFTVLPWILVALLILVFGRNLFKVDSSQSYSREVDKALKPLQKALGLPARSSSETYREWLSQKSEEFPEVDRLIQLTEGAVYSQNTDLTELKSFSESLKERLKSTS